MHGSSLTRSKPGLTTARRLASGAAGALVLALAAAPADAAEGTFRKPTWNGKRLDFCYTWSKNCGQPVADAYCLAAGYQKALGFEPESARPTQLIAQRRTCSADFCQGFKFITCYTSANKPGPKRDGPTMVD